MRIAPAGLQGVLVLGALLALAAGAEEHEPSQPGAGSSDAPFWWAAVGLEGGAFVHELEGSVESSDIANPPIDNPQPIRPPAMGTGKYVTPYIEGSLELFGPALMWGVRPFAGVSLGGEFSVTRDIAKEGTPGEFEIPPNFPGSTTGTAELEALVRGQGSRLSAEFSKFYLTAGIGASIPVETDSHSIRVKPSFRYMRDEVEAVGLVNRAVLTQSVPRPTSLDDFRLISLSASDSQTFDLIGGGLEVDTDLSRKGSMVASVFVAGAVYFVVGDRGFDFAATNPAGEYAAFRVERDPVSYRLGIGVRLRFEP
jgi:hypothetical protein